MEQTAVPALVIAKLYAPVPDPPEPARVKPVPTDAEVEDNVTADCVPWPTVTTCWICVAGWKLPLPDWLALTVQVPAAVKETTPELIAQMLEDEALMLKITVNPDVAVAVGEYVAPPTVADGTGEVMETVWVVSPMDSVIEVMPAEMKLAVSVGVKVAVMTVEPVATMLTVAPEIVAVAGVAEL
jgi:hypothetical protein